MCACVHVWCLCVCFEGGGGSTCDASNCCIEGDPTGGSTCDEASGGQSLYSLFRQRAAASHGCIGAKRFHQRVDQCEEALHAPFLVLLQR